MNSSKIRMVLQSDFTDIVEKGGIRKKQVHAFLKKEMKKVMKKGDEIAARFEKAYEVICANPDVTVTLLSKEIEVCGGS